MGYISWVTSPRQVQNLHISLCSTTNLKLLRGKINGSRTPPPYFHIIRIIVMYTNFFILTSYHSFSPFSSCSFRHLFASINNLFTVEEKLDFSHLKILQRPNKKLLFPFFTNQKICYTEYSSNIKNRFFPTVKT